MMMGRRTLSVDSRDQAGIYSCVVCGWFNVALLSPIAFLHKEKHTLASSYGARSIIPSRFPVVLEIRSTQGQQTCTIWVINNCYNKVIRTLPTYMMASCRGSYSDEDW